MGAPATLPAGFFDSPQQAPETLPANFFEKKQRQAPVRAPGEARQLSQQEVDAFQPPTQFEKDRPGKGITTEGMGGAAWDVAKQIPGGILKMVDPTSGLSGAGLTALGVNPRKGTVGERLNEVPILGAAKEAKAGWNRPTDVRAKLGEAASSGLGSLVGMSGEQAAEAAERGEGGKILGQAAVPAVLALAAPAIEAGVSRLAGPLRGMAATQYERALAPTTKINKTITGDITPELIQRGEAGSLEGLEKRATQKISELSPQLNAAYQEASSMPTSAGNRLPAKLVGAGQEVIRDLEGLKKTYMPEGKIAQPQAVQAIEDIQSIVKQYGEDISPTSLRRMRQIFEEAPAQRGAYAGVDLSTNYTLKAQQAAADSIRGILNRSPDIGTLNKEISFWLDVQRVTRDSGLRQTGQAGGLMKVLSPLGMGAVGSLTGAQFGAAAGLEAGGAMALSTAAYQIARSPAWRTMSAVAKDRLAGALARGNIGEVSALAGRLGITAGRANENRNPQPILGTKPSAPLTPLGQRQAAGTP